MKSGRRALGIAESYTGDTSTLAGSVVRANSTVDGLVFGSCTVGGTDATDAIVALVDDLGREDIQYLLVAGIAPAWFNMLDLHRLHDETGLPALSVSFEDSPGLAATIREEFQEPASRLAIYRAQPARQQVAVEDGTVYLRSVGIEDSEAAKVVQAYTHEGGRPEPVRVARLAARAADKYTRDTRWYKDDTR